MSAWLLCDLTPDSLSSVCIKLALEGRNNTSWIPIWSTPTQTIACFFTPDRPYVHFRPCCVADLLLLSTLTSPWRSYSAGLPVSPSRGFHFCKDGFDKSSTRLVIDDPVLHSIVMSLDFPMLSLISTIATRMLRATDIRTPCSDVGCTERFTIISPTCKG